MDWADDFIPKYQIGPKFPRNCGNILVALLRSCDKEYVWREWNQSYSWLTLAPGGNCFLFRPSDGIW